MRKTTKTIMAFLTAMTMTAGAISLTANAEWFDDVDISTMNEQELKEFIDKVGEELYPSPKQDNVSYYITDAQNDLICPPKYPVPAEMGGERYDLYTDGVRYGRCKNISFQKIYSENAKQGIVFELQDDAKITDLKLKYRFLNQEQNAAKEEAECAAKYSDYSMHFEFAPSELRVYMNNRYRAEIKREEPEVVEDQIYIYFADENTSTEELVSYAEELEKNKAIKYIKVFHDRELSPAKEIFDTAEGNCRIYLVSNNGTPLNADELNNNVQLLKRLEDMGIEGRFYNVDTENGTDFEKCSGIEKNDVKCDVYVKFVGDRTKYFEAIDKLEACEGLENADHVLAVFKDRDIDGFNELPIAHGYDIIYDFEGGIGPNAVTQKNLKKLYESFKKDGDVTVLFVPEYPFDAETFALNVTKEEQKMKMSLVDDIDINKVYLKRLSSPDIGDANKDGKTNVRDCACIANALANGEAENLPEKADYNQDTRKNVRDAAAISSDLAAK